MMAADCSSGIPLFRFMYWDMKRFFQLIRQHGTLRTVRSGEEIVAMGSRRTELFLVTKVRVNQCTLPLVGIG